ncbi:TIGR03364 family FAD-dependent oxidoreductase [Gimesia panareensis]|uniref:TIGR03364 family FAD-dependent oxidoreductase n=1 Tax=Gimesia panareensis TaxID=2527978 RepID=UPI0011877D58|nr:TIGR03364 family FAD-dependent oxidoreductase [Gimesia panareensis]QDU47857.1 bifunctional tRNA (mnm(5)s(2)U34)-methyltransferase/FAD-dependent cmnm(5)s(2)U34 oxidoreductase [Gimesia panareensis]
MSTQTYQQKYDVIVIGGGVLGAFHAYFAMQRGWKTLLIERDIFPQQASVRNFGLIIPSAMPPGIWRDRALASCDIYVELTSQLGVPLRRMGTQYLAHTAAEAQFLKQMSVAMQDSPCPAEFLTAEETIRSSCCLNPEFCSGSLYFPQDLQLDPDQFFRELINWIACTSDCDYLPKTTAVSVRERSSHCQVKTADGRAFHAEHVIVCSGADLQTLFPEEYIERNVQYCKLQMLKISNPENRTLGTSIASPIALTRYPAFLNTQFLQGITLDAPAAELQEHGIQIWMTQNQHNEFILGDSHAYSVDPPTERMSAEVEELIINYARKMFVKLDFQVTDRWCGIYTEEKAAGLFHKQLGERIQLLTGIGGKGMTTGPGLAKENIGELSL